MSAPYDEHIGTHWEGCETERNHHQCALARLEETRAQLAAARAENERLREVADAADALWLAAEEYDFPDGLGQGAEQSAWDDLVHALDAWKECQCAALAPAEQEPPR